MRFALSVVLLSVIYVFTLASTHILDILSGLLASTLLLTGCRRLLSHDAPPQPGKPAFLRQIVAFLPFAFAVLYDILVGTWQVIILVLRLRPLNQPGIVTVPIDERTPAGVAVCTLVTTMSPGSFLVDIDWEKRMMLFHYIDASDPEAVRTMHRNFYHRYQRHIFP